MRAAFYESDITPPIGGYMWGYYCKRNADGVAEKLFAKALVVEDNGGLTALIYPDFPQGLKEGMNQKAFATFVENMLPELNKELPNYARLKKIVVMTEDFERTPKKSIKRYLYQRS
jgi:long-chain acyl-CoA synthetase